MGRAVGDMRHETQEAVLGLEFLLTFMVVLAYLRATFESSDSLLSASAVGLAYMTATVSFSGVVNPAFSLGKR